MSESRESEFERHDGPPPLSAYEDEPATRHAHSTVTASTPTRAQASPPPEDGRAIKSEEEVIGALLKGRPWSEISHVARAEDYSREHRLILAAIEQLADSGEPHDAIMVSQQLERRGHLLAAGGLARLSQLCRDTVTEANIGAHARAVRKTAITRRLPATHHDPEAIAGLQRDLAELEALEKPAAPPAIVLRHVADIVAERRETEWLSGLHKILERRVIAVLAGVRDTLKSFIATHWAMSAAVKGESVLILSGEGRGLGRRIEAWMKEFAPARNLRDLPVIALEHAVRLNAGEVMAVLVAAIDDAGIIPTLILVDTLSKFTPGMNENSTEEMGAFLHLLSSMLREHYGCTVLVVAHAGHNDVTRPRGSSTLMANPDAEYIAKRPDPKEQNILVSRERFKDSPAFPPLAYTAKVLDLGRLDIYGEPVTSCVLWEASAGALIAAKPELQGKAQRQLMAALRAQAPTGPGIWTLADMREIGRTAGLHKNTARAAAEALTFSAHLTATVGGWKLADDD